VKRPFIALVFLGALVIATQAVAAPKVGVLLKSRNAFWTAAEGGALAAGEALGAEIVVKAPPNEFEIAIQIQLLNALVAQEVQAIVIAPCSKDLLVEPVSAAIAKGVKVVVFDTTLAKDVAPVFVGTDQREAGRLAGALLASFVADGDEVGLFKHSQTSGATEQRELGALEKLRELRPRLVVRGNIYSSSEQGVELERAGLLLSQYPDCRAVLASSTPGTMGMLNALRAKGRAGSVKFIGFGFNLNPQIVAALEAGEIHGWVAQLPAQMGYQGVKAALALLEGKSPPAVINTPVVVVTKDNLGEPAIQALLKP
jgi:ribose transport system substrate-binding protein